MVVWWWKDAKDRDGDIEKATIPIWPEADDRRRVR